MGFFTLHSERGPALPKAGSSDPKATKMFRRLANRIGGKSFRRARSAVAAPCADNESSSDFRLNERTGNNSITPPRGTQPQTIHQETPSLSPPITPSLWDRAYDALREDNTKLVEEYEKLLSMDAEMASSEPNGHPGGQSRQAQLNVIITRGLRRVDEKKVHYTIAGHEFNLTEQIAQAAGLVLWAKDLISAAVKASPEASVVWAGVCIILPLLTNPKTAEDASRDGFTYVTTRMRYYTALEPLLERLGQNVGVADTLLAETNSHLVDLYQNVLSFQIQSVLRFYQSRLKGYAKDVLLQKDWKQMRSDIEKCEAAVNGDLGQMNALVARQELETLNQTSTDSLGAVQRLLSVSEQQLGVLKEHRDLAQQQLAIQQNTAQQKLSDKQKKCLQLFRLTKSDQDSTYEWYKGRIEDRIEGTCLWFLHQDLFHQWLQLESGPLLVSADPGCGKSVLVKYLIDHELPSQSAALSTTYCYFFFKDRDQNTARQALCAVLHQLFSKKPALIKHAMGSFDKDGPRLVDSTASLWKIFSDAVRDPEAGSITVALDALDECAESEFEDLMRNIQSQFASDKSQPKLKFLMSSRPYGHIVSKFDESFPCVHIPGEAELDAISQEVNHVIQHRIKQLASKKRLSEEVKARLTDKLLSVPHRTYLWVYLVFEYLAAEDFKKTAMGIEAAISKLPMNVNWAYEKILSKSKQDPIVRKVLCILLAAKRPLTLTEMNVAVAVDDVYKDDDNNNKNSEATRLPSHSILDLDLEDDKNFQSRLRSLCGLFVSVHHDRIYFLHQTAQEFLLRTDLSLSPAAAVSSDLRWMHSITILDAQNTIAEICVRYLHLFNSPDKPPPELGISRTVLLDYTARYWSTHFSEANIDDNTTIMLFAMAIYDENGDSFGKWHMAYSNSDHNSPQNPTSLMLAAFFGHHSIVKFLLERVDSNGGTLDIRDANSRTALFHAAVRGHEIVVKQLLDAGAVVDVEDDGGRTALFHAAARGHEIVVKQLLDAGAVVDVVDDSGWTPLWAAAFGSYEIVVKHLLNAGAVVNVVDNDGWTPLLVAAERGHEIVVKQLLNAGAVVNVVGNDGWTPLSLAVERGHEIVVKQLLDASAAVDAVDDDGQTPLSLAVERGHKTVIT